MNWIPGSACAGGLVILYYLKDRLDDDKSKILSDIRQVILIATPIFGSTSFLGLRVRVAFFSNPQEECLRAFDPDTAMVRASISEKVVNATERSAKQWPIPIQCFARTKPHERSSDPAPRHLVIEDRQDPKSKEDR